MRPLGVDALDHVSMAVPDIRAAAPLAQALGGVLRGGGRNRAGDFLWAQWDLPGGKLEMIQPVDPDDNDHFLVRFLRDRGPGLHHLTFRVADLERAVTAAEADGYRVVGVDTSDPGWKEAFLHPGTTSGVLIQLAEFTPKEPTIRPTSLDEVLG